MNGEETIFGSRKRGGKHFEENARGIMQRSFEYIFDCLDNYRTKAEALGDSF
jgi:tRNA A37 threonylcarbamoyladenosine dehydratase